MLLDLMPFLNPITLFNNRPATSRIPNPPSRSKQPTLKSAQKAPSKIHPGVSAIISTNKFDALALDEEAVGVSNNESMSKGFLAAAKASIHKPPPVVGIVINASLDDEAIEECQAAAETRIAEHAPSNPNVPTINDSLDDEAMNNCQAAADAHIVEHKPFEDDVPVMGSNHLGYLHDAQSASPLATPSEHTIVKDSYVEIEASSEEEPVGVGSPQSVVGEELASERNSHCHSDGGQEEDTAVKGDASL